MCGRYALYGPVSRLREAFDAVPEGFEFEPRWNAAPMQWLPVVRQRPNGERVIHRLRWGLVPSWSKDEAIATRLINARAVLRVDTRSREASAATTRQPFQCAASMCGRAKCSRCAPASSNSPAENPWRALLNACALTFQFSDRVTDGWLPSGASNSSAIILGAMSHR